MPDDTTLPHARLAHPDIIDIPVIGRDGKAIIERPDPGWANQAFRDLTGGGSGEQPKQPPAPAVANQLPGRGVIHLPASSQGEIRSRPVSIGTKQGNQANRARPAAGDRATQRDTRVPVGEPQAAVATPATPAEPDKIKSAREVLSKIFAAFSTERDSRKGAAWRQLQRDLSLNAETLIMSGQITLPQMIDTMQKLEEYMGGSGEEDQGKDAAAVVGAWLRGEEPASVEFDVAQSSPRGNIPAGAE